MLSSIAFTIGDTCVGAIESMATLVVNYLSTRFNPPEKWITRESFIGYALLLVMCYVAGSFAPSFMGPVTGLAKKLLAAFARCGRYCSDRLQSPSVGDMMAPQFGYFLKGGEHYYRCPRTSKLYTITPGRGRFYIDADGIEKYQVIDYEHELVTAPDLIAPEANVISGETPLPYEGLHKSVVALACKTSEGVFRHLGHGHRCGEYLFTNAHVHDSRSGDVYFSKDLKQFWPVGEFTYFQQHYTKATGSDLGAYKVTLGTWAASGVSTFSYKDYNPQSDGRIELTAYDDARTKFMIARGHLHNQSVAQCKTGMLPHTAITRAGYSGTPIFMMKGQKRTIVGIHCGGGNGEANYACSIYELLEFRRNLGLEQKIPMVCEAKTFASPTSKNRQYDRYDSDTSREQRELDEATHAQISDTFGAYSVPKPRPEATAPPLTWQEFICPPYEDSMSANMSAASDDYQELGTDDPGDWQETPLVDAGFDKPFGLDNDELAAAQLAALAPIPEALPPPGLERIGEADEPQDQKAIPPSTEGDDLFDEPIYVGLPPTGEPLSLGPEISPEEREKGEKCFNSKATMPLSVKKLLGVGLLGAAAASILPTGKEVSDEMAATLLRARPSDFATARKCNPVALLNSVPFDRYRSYMSAADVRWTGFDKLEIVNHDGSVVAARMGVSRLHSKSTPAVSLPEKYKQVLVDLNLGPEQGFDDYILPPGGAGAVLDSLEAQLQRTSAEPWPQEVLERDRGNYLRDMLHSEAAKYPLSFSAGFLNVHDFVVKLAKEFDGSKSSGWSAFYMPGTKSAWQTDQGLETASYLVRCRLLLRMAWGHRAMSKMTPEQLFKYGLSDPKVASVKSEPHGPPKAKSKKWRVIWGASMIDNLALGVTCRVQDKLDIASYQDGTGKHSQAVGLGHHPDGVAMIGKHIERLAATGATLFDSDASGWDMSVKRDAILMDAERRIRCYVGPYQDIFTELQLTESMTNSAHMLAFGEHLFSVFLAGVTASGILPTTAQNSFMRAFIARLVGVKATLCGGDDLIGAGNFDIEYERQFGPVEKKVTYREPGEPIEFTSFLFQKKDGVWTADFANLGKSCAKLAFAKQPVTPEQLGGILYHLRDNEQKAGLFREICRRMEWPIDQAVAGPEGD